MQRSCPIFCIIVDRNHFQANFPTEELIPLEPLEEKFKSFGANVVSSNGHDFDAIDVAFEKSEKIRIQ